MSRVKFQHYVPRFYLEGFSGAAGKVWVYDKKLGKVYCRSADQIGGEKSFYDVPKLEQEFGEEQFVEKFFQPFESVAASILRRWLEKLEAGAYFRIYKEERELFSLFLATQIMRTPYHRQFVMQMGAAIEKLRLTAYLERSYPEAATENLKISWDKAREPYLHAEQIVDDETIGHVASILDNHIWTVFPNPTGRPLYTSDNPIIKKPHKRGGWRSYAGYASEGIEINFPLSPRFALSIVERTFWKEFAKFDGKLSPTPLKDENIDHYNSIRVDNATRFIFCPENDFALAQKFCVEFPETTDPERPLVSVR